MSKGLLIDESLPQESPVFMVGICLSFLLEEKQNRVRSGAQHSLLHGIQPPGSMYHSEGWKFKSGIGGVLRPKIRNWMSLQLILTPVLLFFLTLILCFNPLDNSPRTNELPCFADGTFHLCDFLNLSS